MFLSTERIGFGNWEQGGEKKSPSDYDYQNELYFKILTDAMLS